MTAAIKSRLDAIDAQMAELQKEQAKLREELDGSPFVPAWYIAWDGENVTTSPMGCKLTFLDDEDEIDAFLEEWEHCEPFTPELAARFFPKTRYDWAKIVKEYPEAKWASTDDDGRCDLWHEKPEMTSVGAWDGGHLLSSGGYTQLGIVPDWRDSLEARPEGI